MCWGHQKNCCGNSIFHGLRQMINNSNSIMPRSKRKRKKGKPIACVLRKKINYISSTVWTSVRFHDNHLSNIFIFPFFSPPTPCLVAHRLHSVFHSFHFSLAFNVTKNPWKSVETTILSGARLTRLSAGETFRFHLPGPFIMQLRSAFMALAESYRLSAVLLFNVGHSLSTRGKNTAVWKPAYIFRQTSWMCAFPLI